MDPRFCLHVVNPPWFLFQFHRMLYLMKKMPLTLFVALLLIYSRLTKLEVLLIFCRAFYRFHVFEFLQVRQRRNSISYMRQATISMLGRTRAGNEILFRKISAELARNSFRYSVEESAHSEVHERVNSKARNGMELLKNNSFTKQPNKLT